MLAHTALSLSYGGCVADSLCGTAATTAVSACYCLLLSYCTAVALCYCALLISSSEVAVRVG